MSELAIVLAILGVMAQLEFTRKMVGRIKNGAAAGEAVLCALLFSAALVCGIYGAVA